MACRVMVDTADEILVTVAIDDMDAIPVIQDIEDALITEEGTTND